MLYWTNWNLNRPTIERSYLNGSNREIIVKDGLTMPHGLGLDAEEQKIYWANNMRSGSLRIESSFIDGSQRKTIYEGRGHEMRGQFVYGLTVVHLNFVNRKKNDFILSSDRFCIV